MVQHTRQAVAYVRVSLADQIVGRQPEGVEDVD